MRHVIEHLTNGDYNISVMDLCNVQLNQLIEFLDKMERDELLITEIMERHHEALSRLAKGATNVHKTYYCGTCQHDINPLSVYMLNNIEVCPNCKTALQWHYEE